jgi:hypothetical protein
MTSLFAVEGFTYVILTPDRSAEAEHIVAECFADEPTVRLTTTTTTTTTSIIIITKMLFTLQLTDYQIADYCSFLVLVYYSCRAGVLY